MCVVVVMIFTVDLIGGPNVTWPVGVEGVCNNVREEVHILSYKSCGYAGITSLWDYYRAFLALEPNR